MSIKTTQRITRAKAMALLMTEILHLPNDALADLLDVLADSGQSHAISCFDNFIVTEFPDDPSHL